MSRRSIAHVRRALLKCEALRVFSMWILTVGDLKEGYTDEEIAAFLSVPVQRVVAIRKAWDGLLEFAQLQLDLWMAVTDKMVAEIAGLTRKMVVGIRARFRIRKRPDYHTWKGTDFRMINTTRQNRGEAKAAAPLLGVSMSALYNAKWRFAHR